MKIHVMKALQRKAVQSVNEDLKYRGKKNMSEGGTDREEWVEQRKTA